MDIWIKVRIRLGWLLAAIVATKRQSERDHDDAVRSDDLRKRAELHAQGELQHEAWEGLRAAQKEFDNDHE